MHLDTDQALLHHLVAADGREDVKAEEASPGTAVIVSLFSLVTLIVVMAMCACRKKTPSEPGEPMLKEATPVANRKSQLNSTVGSSPIEEADVKLVVSQRDSRHSNGSVIMGKENGDNGRPKSHDQRALPEIPAVPLAGGVMQTDDEDDDEGHYDVISRNRAMAASQSAASVSGAASPARRGLNLYEKVGTACDLTYSGMKNDDEMDNNEVDGIKRSEVGNLTSAAAAATAGVDDGAGAGGSASRGANPYAVVDGIGMADYAHVDEGRKLKPSLASMGGSAAAGAAAVEVAGGKSVTVIQRIQALEAQAMASTDSLNDGGSTGPPVPDKNFEAGPSPTSLGRASAVVAPPSPLPSQDASVMSSTDGSNPLVCPGTSTSSESGPLGTSTAAVDPLSGVDDGGVLVLSDEPSGPDSPTNKREPPYSSVTARESLANLRQRQAVERQQLQPLPHDATYESVNYDQITSPAVSNLNALTSDRNSMTSDLYAEIASGSGENSTRSSVYAKVGEVSEAREAPAPTPPPMDFLKHLPKDSKSEDELPDPGYSIIRRGRPTSAYASIHTPPRSPPAGGATTLRDDDDEDGTNGQPVYAVVDKSRRNRNTVCGAVDMNENVSQMLNGIRGSTSVDVGEVQEMYAQVNKSRRVPNKLEFGQSLPPTAAYIGSGARPKVRSPAPGGAPPTGASNNNPIVGIAAGSGTRGLCSPSNQSMESDPAYQTIPSDLGLDDPGYEDIALRNVAPSLPLPTASSMDIELDPNYESVRVETVTRTRLTSPGVATEIVATEMVTTAGGGSGSSNPHGMVHISDHHVDSSFWQRHEHVYQEIGTAQRDLGRLGVQQRAAAEGGSAGLRHISTDL